MGREPNPDKMPLDASVFPYEVQVAFFIYALLPQRWDGMNGYYLGVDWAPAEFFMKTYNIENIPEVVQFIALYDAHRRNLINDKVKAESEKAQKKPNVGSIPSRNTPHRL